MCGIFALLSCTNEISDETIHNYYMKGKKRGPESSNFHYFNLDILKIFLGFHRLAINGLNITSDQPIVQNKNYLICNGEIYNYKELIHSYNIIPKTNSDCEVILSLYDCMGIKCSTMLDGDFSYILYDEKKNEIIVSRDPYGLRSLYECHYKNGSIGFASDLECLCFDEIKSIYSFEPGTISIYKPFNNTWKMSFREKYFYNISYLPLINIDYDINYYMYECVKLLKKSIKKRVDTCERDIACLLSGGLDSSIISAFVCKMYREKTGRILETYSIGLQDAEDLSYAKQVSEHIKSKHKQVIMTNEQFIDSIPHVIKDIESYDTTSVRASVGNWNIGKYISKNSEAKVIFNGDGSDELAGGYLYFHSCPTNEEFHNETQRLLKDIHHFDVLRSDKSISSHGLETRTPFLDKEFTQFYLSIPIEYRNHNHNNQCEKYFIRKAIELYEPDLLPKNVLWRTKEAFSDGVSSLKKSWYEIIQDYVKEKKNENNLSLYNSPKTKEQIYYRNIFNSIYPDKCDTLIPYFWMPKYVKHKNDASARTLELYSSFSEVVNGTNDKF